MATDIWKQIEQLRNGAENNSYSPQDSSKNNSAYDTLNVEEKLFNARISTELKIKYKAQLERKVNDYFEGIYYDFKSTCENSISPFSNELEEKLNSILEDIRILSSIEDCKNHDLSLRQVYSRFELTGLGTTLEESTQYDAYQKRVHNNAQILNAIQKIYTSSSDSYFKFEGKSHLLDMLRLDRNSYLDYFSSMESQIENVCDFQEEVNKVTGFASDSTHKLKPIETSLDDLKTTLDSAKVKVDEYYDAICDEIDLEEEQYREGIKTSVSGRVSTLKEDIGSAVQRIGVQIGEASSQIKTLNSIYNNTKLIEKDITAYNVILEDANKDLKQVIGELDKIKMNLGNPTIYIDNIIRKSKDMYMKNGEFDLQGVTEGSIYAEDMDFLDSAYEKAQVDSLFDAGLIDSNIDRDIVTLGNAHHFIDIDSMTDEEIEIYLEKNVNSKVTIDMFERTLAILQSNIYMENYDYNDPRIAKIAHYRAACDSLLGHDDLYSVTDIKIGDDILTASSLYRGNGKDVEDLTITEMWYIGKSANEKVLGNIVTDIKSEEINELRKEIEEIDNGLLDAGYDLANLGAGNYITIPTFLEIGLIVAKLMATYDYSQAQAEKIAKLIKRKSELQRKLDVLIKYSEYKELFFDIEYTQTKSNGTVDVISAVVIPNEETATMMRAIDNAYIISQGPGTPGYEKAMEWSYKQAKANGSKSSNFNHDYYETVREYETELEILSNMSLEEMVENYDEYSSIIATIRSSINPASL